VFGVAETDEALVHAASVQVGAADRSHPLENGVGPGPVDVRTIDGHPARVGERKLSPTWMKFSRTPVPSRLARPIAPSLEKLLLQ
jgi:hypothetical protein